MKICTRSRVSSPNIATCSPSTRPSSGAQMTFTGWALISVWHAACNRLLSAIGSQASSKSFGHHPGNQMIRHRSILYIGGGFRARRALAEAAAAEIYRTVSAAHRQNAPLEFGTDHFDERCADRLQRHLDLLVSTLNPERNRPHNFQNRAASLGSATPGETTLPI